MPIISINEIQRITPFLKLVLQRLREDERSITTPRWSLQLEDFTFTENQMSSAHVASIDSVEQKEEDENEKSNSDDKLPIIFDDLIRHTQLVVEERDMIFFHTLTSHRCPESGKEHGYYGPHRCFRCDTQLCKVSSISRCSFLTPNLAVSTVATVNAQKFRP
jgi:hypothetical protein